MNIKVLRQRKIDLTKKAGEILDAAGPDGLTAEQKVSYEELKGQIQSNNEMLALCEEQADRERAAGDAIFRAEAPVRVLGDNSDSDPKGGFKNHVEFMTAVMNVGKGAAEDKRLVRFRAAQGSDEQGTYSDPYGNYLVPMSILPGVLSLTPEDDPFIGRTTQIPMTTPMVTINARVDKNHSTSVSGGLTVSRRPETVDGTTSRMAFEPIQLHAHENFGAAFASESILQDSPISFVAVISAGFRDEFASAKIKERIIGTGVGEPLGILNSGCLVSVAKETGQAAATILTENIDKMAARCWRFRRAFFLANQTAQPQLRGLVRAVGTGGSVVPYYLPATTEGGFDTLVGRPIFYSEHCKALGTVGDIILIVGSEYFDATYQGLQQDESMHVRFLARERCFRFYLRDDGQPWWKSVLTPKNGDTLSPFVVLATRA